MVKSALTPSQLAKVAAIRERFAHLFGLPRDVFSAAFDIARAQLREEKAQKSRTIDDNGQDGQSSNRGREMPSEAEGTRNKGILPKRVLLNKSEMYAPVPEMTVRVSLRKGQLTICRKIADRMISAGTTGISLIQYGNLMALRFGRAEAGKPSIPPSAIKAALSKPRAALITTIDIAGQLAEAYHIDGMGSAFLLHVRASASPQIWEITGIVDVANENIFNKASRHEDE